MSPDPPDCFPNLAYLAIELFKELIRVLIVIRELVELTKAHSPLAHLIATLFGLGDSLYRSFELGCGGGELVLPSSQLIGGQRSDQPFKLSETLADTFGCGIQGFACVPAPPPLAATRSRQ